MLNYSDILEYIYPLKHEISYLGFIKHNQCKCILMYSGLMIKITGLKKLKNMARKVHFEGLSENSTMCPWTVFVSSLQLSAFVPIGIVSFIELKVFLDLLGLFSCKTVDVSFVIVMWHQCGTFELSY